MFLSCMCRSGVPLSWDRKEHGCLCNVSSEHINKITLIAFTKNDIGNTFWNTIGWTKRPDVNYYEFVLNEENITAFIEEG